MYPDWAPGSKITAKRMALHGRLLEEFELGGDAGSVLIAGIVQTYRNLRLVMRLRGTAAADQIGVFVQMNSTATGYASSLIQDFNAFTTGASTNVGAWHVTGQVGFNAGFAPAANASSGAYSSTEMIIPGYSDATKRKMADARGGYLDGTRHYTMSAMSHVADTAAVQSLVIVPSPSGAVRAGSSFALYGW